MAFSVEYVYRILDRYSGPLGRIERATDKFRAKAANAASKVDRLSSRLEKSSQTMANFRTAIGGAAITAGMFQFAKTASTIEDAMSDVERVTGLTGRGLEKMQERLQRMGRETGRSAEGLAAIAFEGGKLGIANEKLVDFVLMVTKTAAAFDMVDSEAGRAIGSIRAKLGLSVDSVNALMQRVNFLADNTSAAGNQMIEIIERTSGTFGTLNIPDEAIAGWAAFANQLETSPELAASGLNMMMARMMKMPGMLEKMLKDPKNSVIDFLKRFEKIPEARRGTAILKTFGDEAGRFVLKAVKNTKLLDDAMQKAASTEALGSMDREFANILARSSTAGKRIKETFIDISRTIGAVFLRVFDKYSERIQKATEFVLKFVKTHPGLVKIVGVAAAILAGITAVVVPLGILFSIIAGGLPILTALMTAVGAISAPVVIAVAGIAAFVAWVGWAYAKSASFRQSLVNLADAFRPIIQAAKSLVVWIGEKLGLSFSDSQAQMKEWGDFFAVIINGIAALIKGLTAPIDNIRKTMQMISETDIGSTIEKGISDVKTMIGIGDTSGSQWAPLRDRAGAGVSQSKAAARAQDNKMKISGQIGVTASNGAKVEKADINLNTGYNLAVMGQ